MKAVITTLTISLLIYLPSAEACMLWPSAEEMKKKSDIVFLGEPDKISCVDDKWQIDFEVSKIWKGEAKKNISVIHASCSNKSGIELNEEYLVYSRLNDKSKYMTNYNGGGMCGQDIQKLRPWLFEWLEMQYNQLRIGSRLIWTLSTGIGANSDIEQLGKPIKEF